MSDFTMKQIEQMFLGSADSYASGYKTSNIALLTKIGAMGSATIVVWFILNFVLYKEPEDKYTNIIGAIGVCIVVFVSISIYRRSTALTVFTGKGIIKQSLLFSLIPFIISTIVMKSLTKSELKTSIIISTFISIGVLLSSKFLYIGSGLEKEIFVKIAEIFESCPGINAAGCDHKHAGFKIPFETYAGDYIRKSQLKPSVIARELSVYK